MAMLEIKNEWLTVNVSTLGAEIQSVKDHSGERIFDGNPAFWPNHAPVLFPYAGGLVNNRFTYEGKAYTAKTKHGFARRCEFAVEDQKVDQLTLKLDTPCEEYPFEYIFRVKFELNENELVIRYITENPSDKETMFFGVGCHEALACPDGIEGCTVRFEEPLTLKHYPLEGAQIMHEAEIIAENCKELPLKYDYFTVDALVFRDLDCKSITLHRPDGHGVTVKCADFKHLLIWTKPNAPYICIEPWTNPPEWVDGSEELVKKSGIMQLLPGQTDTRTHTLRFF